MTPSCKLPIVHGFFKELISKDLTFCKQLKFLTQIRELCIPLVEVKMHQKKKEDEKKKEVSIIIGNVETPLEHFTQTEGITILE